MGFSQGQDLYDSRVSLIQYQELFNTMSDVTFPISVLASVTNQELTSYAWIFPNVVTNGHWWYSNTPTFIEHDAAARLEAVPRTKQIGYYSDMYKLEFALPKFNMYKRILAKILANRFVIDRNWTEEQAVQLGRQVLRGNVETLFGVGACDRAPYLPPTVSAPSQMPFDSDGILSDGEPPAAVAPMAELDAGTPNADSAEVEAVSVGEVDIEAPETPPVVSIEPASGPQPQDDPFDFGDLRVKIDDGDQDAPREDDSKAP